MSDQVDEQSTVYNAARQAAQVNEGASVYDSCGDQFTKDLLKSLLRKLETFSLRTSLSII